jgi:5-methylcytosine-specific restriction endonuclease McrA
MKKGFKHSKETIEKIRLSKLGDKNPNFGKKFPPEQTRRMIEGRKKRSGGYHHSEETRRKMGLSHKGHPISEEAKIKIGLKIKGNKYPKSKEWRMKRSGKNSPNWKGGISFEPYTTDWTNSLRISIRERDKYTCQICGEKQGDRAFAVHHIDYNKQNCCPDNLITICHSCHIKTNYNRDYWMEYFGFFLSPFN